MVGWEGPIRSEYWPRGPRTRQQSLSRRSEEKKTTAQLQCPWLFTSLRTKILLKPGDPLSEVLSRGGTTPGGILGVFSAVTGRMKSFSTHQAAAEEAGCPTKCKCSRATNCEVTSQAWRPGPK